MDELTILNHFRFLKFYEEELGEIASIVVPPVLKKYSDVSSQCENVKFKKLQLLVEIE